MPLIKGTKNIVSPPCRVDWPAVLKPSVYTPPGGVPDPNDKGKYKVKLRLNPDDPKHAEFIRQVNEACEEMENEILAQEGKKVIKKVEEFVPIVPEEDEDGNPTGTLLLRAGKKAGGVSVRTGKEWSSSLAVVDVKGRPFVPEEGHEDISSGSTIRISVYPRAYQTSGKWGVTLDLSAVRVLEAVYYSKGGASDFDGIDDEDFESNDEFGAEESNGDF